MSGVLGKPTEANRKRRQLASLNCAVHDVSEVDDRAVADDAAHDEVVEVGGEHGLQRAHSRG